MKIPTSENLYVLKRTSQLTSLYTIMKKKDTKIAEFRFTGDRIIRLLVEEALNLLPVKKVQINTPINTVFEGTEFKGKICAVSIMRAGDSMETAIKDMCKKIRVGKILIQRDEKTAKPKLFYSKLPKDISKRYVLLLDPMLATGGSSCTAIDVLKKNNVQEDKIIFVNLISCPEGLDRVVKEFPKIRIVTGWIDEGLDYNKFIIPGLGDFGDRYYGTDGI